MPTGPIDLQVAVGEVMAEVTPQKRALPARERREPAAKRRASSPAQPPSTPAARKPSTAASAPATARKTGYTRGPYKKRASLVHVLTPTSASRSSPSVSIAEDVLPTRIITNKPLPTTKQKQPAKLSHHEYQSIAESAILSASLHQSRMQWLYHGVFEKYWVKPVKRKGVWVEPPNNPDAKSMQRLGAATMTIEPHTFDVVFHIVKDPTAPPPYQRHPNQHTVKHMAPPPHPAPYAGYPPQALYQQPRPAPTHPSTAPTPAPIRAPASTPPTPAQSVATPTLPSPLNPAENGPPPGPATKEENVRHESTAPPPAQTAPSAPPPSEKQFPTPPPGQKPNPPAPVRGSTQDPVIQMLAARAASNPQLKELMKIVATSRASPEQLKEFQSHIDEFNEVIRRQEAERVSKSEERPTSRPPSNQPASETSQVPGPAASTQSKPATASAAKAAPPPTQARATAPAEPSRPNAPQPQPRQQPTPAPSPAGSTAGAGAGALPGVVHTFPQPAPANGRGGPMSGYVGYPSPAPARPEPLIKHIVVEITSVPSGGQSACPDRWLFPEYAVLEMRPGGLEMICSFLVERKGSQIMAGGGTEAAGGHVETDGNWNADEEYYQPVTMTIKTLNHKTIETIAKAAKTLPAVQEYMKEVMGKKQRAPMEYLVHQLPRDRSHVGADSTETGFVDSGVELGSDSGSEEDELKDFYGI